MGGSDWRGPRLLRQALTPHRRALKSEKRGERAPALFLWALRSVQVGRGLKRVSDHPEANGRDEAKRQTCGQQIERRCHAHSASLDVFVVGPERARDAACSVTFAFFHCADEAVCMIKRRKQKDTPATKNDSAAQQVSQEMPPRNCVRSRRSRKPAQTTARRWDGPPDRIYANDLSSVGLRVRATVRNASRSAAGSRHASSQRHIDFL